MTIMIPPNVTGIKTSICDSYLFDDQSWFNKTDPESEKKRFLAERCVRAGGTYYIYNPNREVWTPQPDRAACLAALAQQYRGTIGHNDVVLFISMEDLKNFLITGIVSFEGITYAPGLGSFVTLDGQIRLNIYKDYRLHGDNENIDAVEEWLKVIRNSLCAEAEELDLPAMLDEIASKKLTPFRWLMHWLAYRYQRPGGTTGTNLWLLGSLGGVGKGTLISALRGVMGGAAVGQADQGDIQRGWTDSLFGKQVHEWDEFKMPDGWHAFGRFLKKWTGNEFIQVTSRNKGSLLHPAVGMHIFTTNDPLPMLVEEKDRRNTFIETTMNDAWADRARALYDHETGEFYSAKMLSGFAVLLCTIEVDVAFIRRPLETEKKKTLREYAQDSAKQWVLEGGLSSWMPAGHASWKDLYEAYKEWTSFNTHTKPHDLATFRTKMKEFRYASTSTAPRSIIFGGKKTTTRYVVLTPPEEAVMLADLDGRDNAPVLTLVNS